MWWQLIKLWFLIISVFLAVCAMADGTDINKQKDCIGPLRQVLVAGKYSGSLDCSLVNIVIQKIGKIAIPAKSYTIYDLRYKTIPPDGLVSHGGQKILVIMNDQEYVGQYSLSPPPMHNMHIRGSSIYLDIPKKNGNRVRFDESGPPAKAFIDEEVVTLSR